MIYINTEKRKLVNSVNFVIDKKISFDYDVEDTLTLTFLDKQGKILQINQDDQFYIIANTVINGDKPIFFSNQFDIEDNTVTFTIDTYTDNYFEKIKNKDSKIYVEIGRKLAGSNHANILYQDEAVAQPRIKTDGTPLPVVIDRTFIPVNQTTFEDDDSTIYYISSYKQDSLLDRSNKVTCNRIILNYEETKNLRFKIFDKSGVVVPLLPTDQAYIAVSTSFDNIIAYSDTYMIDDNTLTFKLDTLTVQFLQAINQPAQSILIEVGYKHVDDQSFKVIYQGENIAYPRIFSTLNPPDLKITKYYTAEQVDILIDSIDVNPEDYYTKSETNTLLENVQVDLTDYYNKGEVDTLLGGVQVDLSDYYTKTEVNTLLDDVQVDLSDYYTKTEADGKFLTLSTYSPRMLYTYVHPVYGRSVYLDSITTTTKTLDKVNNLHKILLKVFSNTAPFTGNVKLDFYVDDLFVKSQLFASGSTTSITFDTPVSGAIKIVRDYANVTDTLKDGVSTIACIIPVIRISEG